MGEPSDGAGSPRPGRLGGVDGAADELTASRSAAAYSRLHAILRAGDFAVTCELATADSADPAAVYHHARALAGKVDAVNCTDNSAAHPHLSSQAAAHFLTDCGIEPIVQLGCRDRNRIGLQADLLGAAALGARNVVLMTGDDASAGDHPEARAVWDLDALHAIRIARILRDEGTYLSGRRLETAPSYLVGAVENPFAPPFDARPRRLRSKVEAGAEFVQTQICFNPTRLREFMGRAGDLGVLDALPVLVGVYIPRSARSARYLRDQVPGIDVPEAIIARLESRPLEEQAQEGFRLASELVQAVREIPGVAGVHLMSIGGAAAIVGLIEELGLLPRPVPNAPVRRKE